MSGTTEGLLGSADLDQLRKQLEMLQQLTQPTPQQMQLPAVGDQRPVDRSWASKLGEGLGGGQTPLYKLSPAEAEAAGNRALIQFGIGMMSSPYDTTMGQALARGLGGAGNSLLGSQEAAYTQAGQLQDWMAKQRAEKLDLLKTALPLLQRQGGSQPMPDPIGGGGGGGGGGNIYSLPKADFLAAVAKRESGGNPLAKNYVWEADPTAYERGATASGKYQMVNETWRAAAKAAGVDTSKYPTARDAPEAVQDQVASKLYDMQGTAPWDPATFGQRWVKGEGGKYTLVKGSGEGGGGGGGATTATPPAATPPAATTATKPTPPTSPFGTGAFTPPTRSVAAAPETTATAPNVPTNLVPPVNTPQMVAAQAVAARTKQPAPIEGSPGLFALPGGGVSLGPNAGGLGRRAAADALLEGAQTAETTLPPQAALVAGPGAPTGGAAGAPDVPSQTAFGGGAFATRPPAMVAQPPAASPATSPPTTATPAQVPSAVPPRPQGAPDEKTRDEDLSFAQYKQRYPIEFSPQEQRLLEQTPGGGELAAIAQQKRDAKAAVDRAEAARRAGSTSGASDYSTAIKHYDDVLENERKALEKAREGGNTLAAQMLKDKETLAHTSWQALQANKAERLKDAEHTLNDSTQKKRDELAAEGKAATARINALEGLRVLSDQVGPSVILGDQVVQGRPLYKWFEGFGLGTEEYASRMRAADAFKSGLANFTKEMRQGLSLGGQSDAELRWLQDMGPQLSQDPATRQAVIGYMLNFEHKKLKMAQRVDELMTDRDEAGRPRTYLKALEQARQEAGPIVPRIPDRIWKSQDMNEVNQWYANNAPLHTMYYDGNGDLRIHLTPAEEARLKAQVRR